MPRKSRKSPVFLDGDEPERLMAAAKNERDRLIILIGLRLGLRVSEIVGLRVERLNFPKGQVLVYQGKGGKDRTLPLHASLFEPLQKWLGGKSEGWLFPSPANPAKHLTSRSVQYMIEAAAKRAGIRRPDGQRITPHKLRHSFCTKLFERGVDPVAIRDLMGHSNLATTNIYAHSNAERLRGAIEKL